jgi:mRNA interferase MazF
MLCPITNRQKGYPFEVPLPPGYPVIGVVLADQAKSLSWQMRQAEPICRAPPGLLQQTRNKIKILLQLP